MKSTKIGKDTIGFSLLNLDNLSAKGITIEHIHVLIDHMLPICAGRNITDDALLTDRSLLYFAEGGQS